MFKIKNEKLMMYDISDNYRKYLSKYDRYHLQVKLIRIQALN